MFFYEFKFNFVLTTFFKVIFLLLILEVCCFTSSFSFKIERDINNLLENELEDYTFVSYQKNNPFEKSLVIPLGLQNTYFDKGSFPVPYANDTDLYNFLSSLTDMKIVTPMKTNILYDISFVGNIGWDNLSKMIDFYIDSLNVTILTDKPIHNFEKFKYIDERNGIEKEGISLPIHAIHGTQYDDYGFWMDDSTLSWIKDLKPSIFRRQIDPLHQNYSIFQDKNIYDYIHDFETLIFLGLPGDLDVKDSVIDALDRGYNVDLITDLTYYTSLEKEKKTLIEILEHSKNTDSRFSITTSYNFLKDGTKYVYYGDKDYC